MWVSASERERERERCVSESERQSTKLRFGSNVCSLAT